MPQGSGHSVPMTFEELLAHHAAITAQAEHDRQALQIALLTIDKLKTEIAYLKRMRYGRSSERLEHDTQMLLMDEAHAPSSPVQSHVDESLGNVVDLQRERHKRQAKDASLATAGDLPTHLPRRTVVHPPQPCACGSCDSDRREIGADVSEQLDYEPGSFHVLRHVRPKLACGCGRISQAAAPPRPITRGLPGAGLLAHVAVSKFADHQPLYRQSQIHAREGVHLSRSTLCDWLAQAARLLTPLAEAVGRYVLQAAKIHGDDTPVRVLGGKGAAAKTGRLWVYVRDDRPAGDASAPAVWLQYSANRKGEHPQRHLRHWRGILQADAFAGYNALYEDGGIIEAACWSHARRKFWDIHERQHRLPGTLAHQALERIGRLFAIEADIRGRPPDERYAVRQERTRIELDALKAWLDQALSQLSAKSALAGAIGYTLTNWRALTRFVGDGRIEAHNNAAERALRAVAIGRKNYLHLGSDAGGASAAVFYTLIGTAKLNAIEPQAYLRYVLERIGEHPINRVDELLPWAVADRMNTERALPLAA